MVLGRLAGGAVTFHLVAFYTDQGLSAALAASSIGLYAFMGAIANLIWGFLVERMSERPLLVAAMVLSGLSLLFMLPTHSPLPALVLAALFGFAGRGEGTLVTTVLAQYFGRASFGRIMGSMAPFNMAALGLGPLVASIAFDLVGSYTSVFAVFSCAYLAAALLLSLVRAPSKRVELRSR
jgi:MFS family permease